MDCYPPDILGIVSEFEKKIMELNNTFRFYFEEMLNKPIEGDLEKDEITFPEIVRLKLQAKINDLYLYFWIIIKRYLKTEE